MRAFLLSLLILITALPAARAQDADPNDGVRRFINGTWQLVFREEVKGGTGDIKAVATTITIVLRYDGTRTITQSVQIDDQPPVQQPGVTNDYYRVDEIDGTKFTLTTWGDDGVAQTTTRFRTGADTMQLEGNDAVYQRVAGSQETPPAPLPPQRDVPGGAPPAPPPAAPAMASMGDAQARDFMVGVWTASLTGPSGAIESRFEYRSSGEVVGTQTVTREGNAKRYDFAGAYTAVATGPDRFRLTFFVPGQQPIATELQVVDQNTLFNAKENYQAKRIQ